MNRCGAIGIPQKTFMNRVTLNQTPKQELDQGEGGAERFDGKNVQR